MKLLNTGAQLYLPLTPKHPEPVVADAGSDPRRRPDAHKLAGELTDAELLTTLLGPTAADLCGELTATYTSLREIALLNPAVLVHHGFTTGAIRAHGVRLRGCEALRRG